MNSMRTLFSEPTEDNHFLETDIMRFVAIIGMVLWIIFAIAKSIPFHPPKTDSSLSVRTKEQSFQRQPPPSKINKTPVPEKNRVPSQAIKTSSAKKPEAEDQNAGSEQPGGLQIQFTALEDLLALMAGGKVRVFCRTRTAGFDLLFEGHALGGSVTFQSTEHISSDLWEIRSGKDHAYFLNRLRVTYPAIHSFPLKQVLLAFTDKGLNQKVEQTLDRFRNAGKEGIISIGRRGNVIFQGQNKQTENFE